MRRWHPENRLGGVWPFENAHTLATWIRPLKIHLVAPELAGTEMDIGSRICDVNPSRQRAERDPPENRFFFLLGP